MIPYNMTSTVKVFSFTTVGSRRVQLIGVALCTRFAKNIVLLTNFYRVVMLYSLGRIEAIRIIP